MVDQPNRNGTQNIESDLNDTGYRRFVLPSPAVVPDRFAKSAARRAYCLSLEAASSKRA